MVRLVVGQVYFMKVYWFRLIKRLKGINEFGEKRWTVVGLTQRGVLFRMSEREQVCGFQDFFN